MASAWWQLRNHVVILAELAELKDWILSDQWKENKVEIEFQMVNLRKEIEDYLVGKEGTELYTEMFRELKETLDLWFLVKNQATQKSVDDLLLRNILSPPFDGMNPSVTTQSQPRLSSAGNLNAEQLPSSEESIPVSDGQQLQGTEYERKNVLGRRRLGSAFEDFEVKAEKDEVKKRKLTGFVSRFALHLTRAAYNQATISILENQPASEDSVWKVGIKKIGIPAQPMFDGPTKDYMFVGALSKLDLPVEFQAGHQYEVTVLKENLLSDGVSSMQSIRFHATLTMDDLRELHQKAVGYASGANSVCTVLYRTKSPDYFKDVQDNHGNVMKVYLKDNSGDRASPINSRLQGTFFLASVEPGTNGQPAFESPFGTMRLCIPAIDLLQMLPHIYFADMYCMRSSIHQVTLVITKPGSQADLFCTLNLIPLSIHDQAKNPFLFFDASGQLRVSATHRLIVEVLVTEDIDIGKYNLTAVPSVGKGCTTPGGVPKNPNCQICNLLRPTAFEKF